MRKSEKVKNIEELNKRLLGENEINEPQLTRPRNLRNDLNNPDDADVFEAELTSLLNKYLGISYTNNAGTSNDNRIFIQNNLMDIVNQRFVPSSLRLGSNGSEYYTNRPEEMAEYLQSIGITDFELKSVK
jgi:hypothetical protein